MEANRSFWDDEDDEDFFEEDILGEDDHPAEDRSLDREVPGGPKGPSRPERVDSNAVDHWLAGAQSHHAPDDPKAALTPADVGRVWLWASFGGLVGTFLGLLIGVFFIPRLAGVNPVGLLQGEYRVPTSPKIVVERGGGSVADATVGAVRKARPSVVNIRTRQGAGGLLKFGHELGVGSGIVIRSDGYILTNNHVVSGAEEIWVKLPDNSDVPAELVGRDADGDIAVIKVPRSNLVAAEVGNSTGVKVGETVIAVGSPFGFDQSVTSGIVSAIHRRYTIVGRDGKPVTLTDLMQTDAAINPGNSGGALCNAKGQIIGVNTAIATRSRGFEGIGFAIPIREAIGTAGRLIRDGSVTRPYIGVIGLTVDEAIAEKLKLPVTEGALITGVVVGGPASRAGLRKGDVVSAAGGGPVRTIEDLIAQVRAKKIGGKITLVYLRGAVRRSALVVIREKPVS